MLNQYSLDFVKHWIGGNGRYERVAAFMFSLKARYLYFADADDFNVNGTALENTAYCTGEMITKLCGFGIDINK